MKITMRYDDRPNSSRDTAHVCNIDVYANFREDLVLAQHIINALLNVLPAEKEPGDAHP